jgi:hypothetical protein
VNTLLQFALYTCKTAAALLLLCCMHADAVLLNSVDMNHERPLELKRALCLIDLSLLLRAARNVLLFSVCCVLLVCVTVSVLSPASYYLDHINSVSCQSTVNARPPLLSSALTVTSKTQQHFTTAATAASTQQ